MNLAQRFKQRLKPGPLLTWVAILLVGIATLQTWVELFHCPFGCVNIGTVNNAIVLNALIFFSENSGPLAIVIIILGLALLRLLSLRWRFHSCLFLVLSAWLIMSTLRVFLGREVYHSIGATVLNGRTYRLIESSEFLDDWFTLTLCECETSLACQCRDFYFYYSPIIPISFVLVPDKATGEVQVLLNGKVLYVDGASPRCYAQMPLIIDGCIDGQSTE